MCVVHDLNEYSAADLRHFTVDVVKLFSYKSDLLTVTIIEHIPEMCSMILSITILGCCMFDITPINKINCKLI